MEFEKIKGLAQELRAPENLAGKSPSGDFDNLLHEIQRMNKKSIKTLKGFLIIMPIAAIIMVGLLLVNPDPDLTFSHRLTGGFVVAAFILYMPFAYKWYMLLKATELGLPIIKFLEISEMRHRFWHRDSWMVIPYALLLCGALNTTIMGRYWPEDWSQLIGYLLVNIGFLLFILFAYWHNYRVWKRDKMPVQLEIKKLLLEFASEEKDD